jgi:hypothetical protein
MIEDPLALIATLKICPEAGRGKTEAVGSKKGINAA